MAARAEMGAFELSGAGGQGLSSDALFDLGLKYSTGRDVPSDMIAAHKWFNLAALRGNQAAKTYRSELASEMSKLEIAEAQRLAREWLQHH